MRVDLAGEHLVFHLLLLVFQLLLFQPCLVDERLFFLNFPNHDLEILEGFRELVVAVEGIHDVVVSLACLMHGASQGGDPGAEIPDVI